MTAKIEFTGRIRSGSICWIDKPVMRIGSDPESDVCIPSADVAQHAVTIEYRQGAYTAYNRQSDPIKVTGIEVSAGSSAVWKAGTELQIGENVALRLVQEGDGAPSAESDEGWDRESDEYYDDIAEDEWASNDVVGKTKADAAESGSKETLIQLAVIAMCFVGIIVIAATQFIDFGGAPVVNTINVESLLNDLAKASAETGSRDFQRIEQQLKLAEFAWHRGDEQKSRIAYMKLRNLLQERKEVLGNQISKVELEILRYVHAKL